MPPGRAACAHVDVAQLPGGEEQGPRLQELAAAQLASHQASLVVVTNAEQLRDSGLAVFLQLIGAPRVPCMVCARCAVPAGSSDMHKLR